MPFLHANNNRQWIQETLPLSTTESRVAPKSKPLSNIIIQSYLKPSLRLTFKINFDFKKHNNIKSVGYILCVTLFVTSSLAVFEAAIWVTSVYIIKSWLKIKKNKEIKFFYINLHLKDRLKCWSSSVVLKQADARESIDIIYLYVTHIASLRVRKL